MKTTESTLIGGSEGEGEEKEKSFKFFYRAFEKYSFWGGTSCVSSLLKVFFF